MYPHSTVGTGTSHTHDYCVLSELRARLQGLPSYRTSKFHIPVYCVVAGFLLLQRLEIVVLFVVHFKIASYSTVLTRVDSTSKVIYRCLTSWLLSY